MTDENETTPEVEAPAWRNLDGFNEERALSGMAQVVAKIAEVVLKDNFRSDAKACEVDNIQYFMWWARHLATAEKGRVTRERREALALLTPAQRKVLGLKDE